MTASVWPRVQQVQLQELSENESDGLNSAESGTDKLENESGSSSSVESGTDDSESDSGITSDCCLPKTML